jgi:hypothetical protein
MNIIQYAMKTVRWTPIAILCVIVVIAAALAIRAADAPRTIAAKSAVKNVLNTAEEATIPCRTVAENHCVAGTPTITQCPMEEMCRSASDALVESKEKNLGWQPASSLPNDLLNSRKKMNEKDYLSDLDKTVLDGIELGVFKDNVGRRFLNLYRHGIRDSFVIHTIEERVRKAQRKLAFSGCPFRVPELHQGDYTFGYDIYGREIKDWRQSANAHTLITGTPGCGKTNLSKRRALEIISKGDTQISCCLVDFRKKEYRSLRPMFAEVGIDLKIIRGRLLKLNPLEVPYAVQPIEYASLAADFIVKSLSLPPRASTLLRSTIIKLYMHYGVFNGSQQYPTLFHLFAAVKADRNANPQARQAVLDNLEAVLLAIGPEMLAYHKGWSVHELAKQNIVIELTGLPEAGKDLILAYLLTAEFSSRIAQGISNCLLNWYIAADECQRIFAQDKESSGHEGNALIDLIGLVRGAGIGFEASVLTTHNLSNTLPNLMSTKIAGRATFSEITAVGGFMGLNSEQIMWAVHHLQPGVFLGQLSEGDFRYPFIFSTRLLQTASGKNEYVSDAEADRSIGGFSKIKLLPASGI